jgi:hypothetical protein
MMKPEATRIKSMVANIFILFWYYYYYLGVGGLPHSRQEKLVHISKSIKEENLAFIIILGGSPALILLIK